MNSSGLARRTPPLAALAVAVVAVSTSAILVRWSAAPSPVKALYRVLFTVGLILPWALVRYRDDFTRLRPRDALFACISGVALAVHFASWFESLEWTSVAASVTLVQAQPLFVAVGAWALLDERITRRTVLGIVVALFGMVAMSLGELRPGVALAGSRPLFGNALAVIGAIAAACYFLAGRSIRQRVALVPYVSIVYSVCALVLLCVTVWEGHALVGYPPREWGLFLAMAVGPGIVGHTVINWVLEHLESSLVSVSLLGEPVGSTVLALVLLGEVPTVVTVGGGAIVLAGIAVTTTATAGEEPAPTEAVENT